MNIEKMFIGTALILSIMLVGIMNVLGRPVEFYWWLLIFVCASSLGALAQPNSLSSVLALLGKSPILPGFGQGQSQESEQPDSPTVQQVKVDVMPAAPPAPASVTLGGASREQLLAQLGALTAAENQAKP